MSERAMNRHLRDLLLELLAARWPGGSETQRVDLKRAATDLAVPYTTLHSYVSTGAYVRLPTPGGLRALLDQLGASEAQIEEARRLLEEADAARLAAKSTRGDDDHVEGAA
jgi:hypothetical protein